jgi:hypothetical protein
MAWVFAATCLLHVLVSIRTFRYAVHPHIAAGSATALRTSAFFSIGVALVCGVASWKISRRRLSARVWGIAASLMNVLVFVRSNTLNARLDWTNHVGALLVGVIGLVAFLGRTDDGRQERRE